MGNDYEYAKLYTGSRSFLEAEVELLALLNELLSSLNFELVTSEEESNLSFLVVEDEKRWMHVGWLSSRMLSEKVLLAFPDTFSSLFPLVHVEVSDSTALRLELRERGESRDKYMTMKFPWMAFETKEEAAKYQGMPGSWVPYLLDKNRVEELAAVFRFPWVSGEKWSEKLSFGKVLRSLEQLLGWNPHLSALGYSFDMDGLPTSSLEMMKEYESEIYDGLSYKQWHFRYLGSEEIPAISEIFE